MSHHFFNGRELGCRHFAVVQRLLTGLHLVDCFLQIKGTANFQWLNRSSTLLVTHLVLFSFFLLFLSLAEELADCLFGNLEELDQAGLLLELLEVAQLGRSRFLWLRCVVIQVKLHGVTRILDPFLECLNEDSQTSITLQDGHRLTSIGVDGHRTGVNDGRYCIDFVHFLLTF